MGADLYEAGLDLGGPQCLRPGLPFGDEAGALLVRGEHRFAGARLSARRFLRQKTDPATTRQLDRSGVRLQSAADQVQQGRFSGAVAADQPNLGSFGDLRGRLVEQAPPRNAVGQARNGQHVDSLPHRRRVAR